MELPLIKRIKDTYNFGKKNYTHINRYKPIFNKYKSTSSPYSTVDSKTNLINSHFVNPIQKTIDFYSNKLYKKNISINDKYYNSNFFNKKNKIYFPSLSPSSSQSKLNFTTVTKNINTSDNTFFPASSNINDLSSEKRYLKSSKSNPNLRTSNKKEIKKIDKILTKFKLNKIISNNSQNNCYIHEIKNKHFLEIYKGRLFNTKFINYQINKHRHFLFGKDDNQIRKLNNYLINIDFSNSLKKNFSSEDVIKSLNDKDIKLIKANVSYFKDVNEVVIKDLMKIKAKQITLTDILNKETQKDERKEIVKKIKEQKPKINEKENFLFNYGEYINKIINNDLTQRLKKIKLKEEDKEIQKVLNDFTSKININLGKLRSESNIKTENKCFRTFMIHLKDEMQKKYYIKRNRERLVKEKNFQHNNDLKNEREVKEKGIIFECLERYKKGLINDSKF